MNKYRYTKCILAYNVNRCYYEDWKVFVKRVCRRYIAILHFKNVIWTSWFAIDKKIHIFNRNAFITYYVEFLVFFNQEMLCKAISCQVCSHHSQIMRTYRIIFMAKWWSAIFNEVGKFLCQHFMHKFTGAH